MTTARDHIKAMRNAANRAHNRMEQGDHERALDELEAAARRLSKARTSIKSEQLKGGE